MKMPVMLCIRCLVMAVISHQILWLSSKFCGPWETGPSYWRLRNLFNLIFEDLGLGLVLLWLGLDLVVGPL